MFRNHVALFGKYLAGRVILSRRTFYSPGIKIAVLGASGDLGQPLSLMLKKSPLFSQIALYDKISAKGLATELNNIDTSNEAIYNEGKKGLECTLKGAKIVVVIASSPSDNFEENGRIVSDLAKACATYSPEAIFALATSPVNSMLPIACEMYKKVTMCVDPRRMFGITTLDVVRANTFVSEVLQVSPDCVEVPVIGGHSPNTVIPLLSHIKPCTQLTTEETVRITRAVQEAGCEMEEVKGKPGVAALSGAFAVARFLESLAKGMGGQRCVEECAYVMSNIIPTIPYLSTRVELGPDGVQRNLGVPDLTDYECCLMETALPFLKDDIAKGEDFFARCTC